MPIDKSLWIADNGDGTYHNPILYSDYSDPDVIRVNEDFWMVASSFSNSPALPVLHSKDLVNWKVVNYVMEKIPYKDYDVPLHGRGVWAPSIRFNAGLFRVFFPMPDEGIFMSTCSDPCQEWSEPVCIKEARGWIDPCPFWDDDGKAYLVNAFAKSRFGSKSIIQISPMKPDGSGLLGDGYLVFDGHNTQPTIEGPKLYKRNGYYYIFAPAGGVKSGWQTVLRSKKIFGPYKEKIVMLQGDTKINGPHQGGWVTTQTGQDWFIHFQDVGNAGRITHLQPMKWENDWPIIGEDTEEGYGTPVLTSIKPKVGRIYPICVPDDSDTFNGDRLGLQWQWNANYKSYWYKLDQEKKQLILNSQYSNEPLCDVPNLLLQKWSAPVFSASTRLEISEMQQGDIAGMISLGGVYTGLAVEKGCRGYLLVQIIGEWRSHEEKIVLKEINSPIVVFKMNVNEFGKVNFMFGTNKDVMKPIGEAVVMTPGRWVGVKTGLFNINKLGESQGRIKSDYYVFGR